MEAFSGASNLLLIQEQRRASRARFAFCPAGVFRIHEPALNRF